MLVDTLIAIGAFVLAISLLVAVHEWGHYIAARMSKVRVLEYSIGFGPAIWRRKAGADQTEYQLRALPVGGYVRLLDEREGPVAEEELHRSFNRRPYWQRIFVLAAGPGMNFLFAVVAYWVIFMVGIQAAAPLVGGVAPGSVAEQAGVRPGDRIVAVEDRESPTWQAAAMAIIEQILGDPSVQLTVQDEQGARRDLLLDLSEHKKGILEDGNLFAAAGFEPMTDSRPLLGDILPDGPAAAAGFAPGDRILSAGGEDIGTWRQWVEYVRARPGQSVPVTVDRDGTEQRLYLRDRQPQRGRRAGRGRPCRHRLCGRDAVPRGARAPVRDPAPGAVAGPGARRTGNRSNYRAYLPRARQHVHRGRFAAHAERARGHRPLRGRSGPDQRGRVPHCSWRWSA